MEPISPLVAILAAATLAAVSAAVAWRLGSNSGKRGAAGALSLLAAKLRGEGEVGSGAPGSELADVRRALRDGWIRKGAEREEAVNAALERLVAFLRVAVEGPLNRALESPTDSVRDSVADVLAAIDDLEFFLEDPPEGSGPTDVRSALRKVIREFRDSWDVPVRERFSAGGARARVNPDAFMDAVFLVLHNAARFGDGARIEVQLEEAGHEVLVKVLDHGPGFTAEALLHAMDPFYSTSPGGLGLGLPQARRLIEGQGGSVRFSNLDGGGAQVVVALPSA